MIAIEREGKQTLSILILQLDLYIKTLRFLPTVLKVSRSHYFLSGVVCLHRADCGVFLPRPSLSSSRTSSLLKSVFSLRDNEHLLLWLLRLKTSSYRKSRPQDSNSRREKNTWLDPVKCISFLRKRLKFSEEVSVNSFDWLLKAQSGCESALQLCSDKIIALFKFELIAACYWSY